MLFSNLPPVLATQEFSRERSDILAAARTGVTVDPKAAKTVNMTAVRIEHEHVPFVHWTSPWLVFAGDMPIGTKVGIRMPKDCRVPAVKPEWLETEYPIVEAGEPPIVDVSNQTGSILTVEPLREPFKLGTVFNIENVTTYMASEDRPVRRDFIVAMRAEAGERCIRIYPPIDVPRTVVELPQKGARLIVRPECDGVPMPRS